MEVAMIYHLALLLPTSDSASLHRTARRARARANRQLGRGLIAALRRGLRRQAERSARRRAEAVTLRELRQLSDRALADIGLERAQIRDIARSLAADRARALDGRALTERAARRAPTAAPTAAPAYLRLVTPEATETATAPAKERAAKTVAKTPAAAGEAVRPVRPRETAWTPAAWMSRGAALARGRALRAGCASEAERGGAACCG